MVIKNLKNLAKDNIEAENYEAAILILQTIIELKKEKK